MCTPMYMCVWVCVCVCVGLAWRGTMIHWSTTHTTSYVPSGPHFSLKIKQSFWFLQLKQSFTYHFFLQITVIGPLQQWQKGSQDVKPLLPFRFVELGDRAVMNMKDVSVHLHIIHLLTVKIRCKHQDSCIVVFLWVKERIKCTGKFWNKQTCTISLFSFTDSAHSYKHVWLGS